MDLWKQKIKLIRKFPMSESNNGCIRLKSNGSGKVFLLIVIASWTTFTYTRSVNGKFVVILTLCLNIALSNHTT